jgi:hypothetical protein
MRSSKSGVGVGGQLGWGTPQKIRCLGSVKTKFVGVKESSLGVESSICMPLPVGERLPQNIWYRCVQSLIPTNSCMLVAAEKAFSCASLLSFLQLSCLWATSIMTVGYGMFVPGFNRAGGDVMSLGMKQRSGDLEPLAAYR